MSTKYTTAYRLAVGILCLGFLLDTASTLAAGTEMLVFDLNPLVRDLHSGGYTVWSLLRLVVALGLLTACWPSSLTMRNGVRRWHRLAAILLPFSYRNAKAYAIPFAVTAIGPLKAVSAAANFYLLCTGHLLTSSIATMGLGILAGILTSNGVLLLHYRVTSQSMLRDGGPAESRTVRARQ